MPSHSHPSSSIMQSDCCQENCILFLRRLDILIARYQYLMFYEKLDIQSKHEARYIFMSTIYRMENDSYRIISIIEGNKCCPRLIGNIFGFSVYQLINGLTQPTIMRYRSRPWYATTTERLSEVMLHLSEKIQYNSLGRLMLPPSFNLRSATNSSAKIPLSFISNRMDLQIQNRKKDTLTRCDSCCVLQHLVNDASRNPSDRKEAEQILKIHYKSISQQRTIIHCLCKQSRDKNIDVTVLLMDAMSNKHSKLPILVSRPKCIADGVRLPMELTTLQVAENMVLKGLTRHDASYNLSLILDGISKLKFIPSTIYIVLDSAGNNKSYLTFAGLGFILTKIKHLEQFVLLFPTVGHTHMSVDSQFGVLSKTIDSCDIHDPEEYTKFLENVECVSEVESSPTIFDFTELLDHSKHPTGLCSNNHITIAKSSDAIRWLLAEINEKPKKVEVSSSYCRQDPNITVLKYLESCGINAGRCPREPEHNNTTM
ncbi:hypothetical protein B9Z55_017954 [Caenorhabditis nigoni]|uniref:DUF7869 domain-containing protein n=1 Tax=Caenorhabditis nigoni TaxID=1611254 RepID=A0A2G5TC30_9PELO|nr:hypothetical protein B9Z55_017954 [Caenorhabditis nigoni]